MEACVDVNRTDIDFGAKEVTLIIVLSIRGTTNSRILVASLLHNNAVT